MNDSDDVNQAFEAAGYYSVFMVDLPKVSSPAMIVYSGDPLEQFTHDLVEYNGLSTLWPQPPPPFFVFFFFSSQLT